MHWVSQKTINAFGGLRNKKDAADINVITQRFTLMRKVCLVIRKLKLEKAAIFFFIFFIFNLF